MSNIEESLLGDVGFNLEDKIYNKDEDPFYKKETWEDKVERLRANYINEDFDMMIRFLQKVHPELLDKEKHKKFGNIAIELRVIDREFKHNKGSVERKSMTLYDFTDETIKKVKNWYNKNVKNNAVCMYYSVSNFNPAMKTYNENGKPYTKNRINAQNANFSSIVVLDFDDITENSNIKIDSILTQIGLKYDSIRTNVNGWQKIFYLKEPCWDKDIIPKFTKLFLSRGFDVDEAVNNKAQVARVLGSVNNKAFSGVSDRMNQFKVVREKLTNTKVDVEDLWNRIFSLPVKNPRIKVEELNLGKPLTEDELNNKIIKDFNDVYGSILSKHWIKVIPLSIKKMFIDTDNEGYTNDFLLFIVAYIKNTMKFNREDFVILMDRWAEFTKYDEREKYIYIWDSYSHIDSKGIPYKHGKESKKLIDKYGKVSFNDGRYTTNLAKRYGSINFRDDKYCYDEIRKKEENFEVEECKDKVVLNNRFTRNNTFKEISDGAIQVFLCILVQKILSQKEYVLSNEIIGHRLLNIKVRQTKEYLSELVKRKYIYIEPDFKGNGHLKYFVSSEYAIFTATRNLVFGVHEMQRMLEQLKPNELKLYILLKSLLIDGAVDKYNNKALATMLGVTDKTIKNLKKKLVEKGFIAVVEQGYKMCLKYVVFS